MFKEVVKKRKDGKKFHSIVEFFTNTEIEKCPKCDGVLREKKGKYGKFFACSNYPKCRFTKPIK
jgi:ssDNA-binding Zn-finger/Zn-ribbon topoisomerase 1